MSLTTFYLFLKGQSMKKIFIVFATLVFCTVSVFAHPYEAFNIVMSRNPGWFGSEFEGTLDDSLARKRLDEFAKNVGQAIGGGAFGSSAGLDTFGFNLSAKMSYQQVTSDDVITNRNGDGGIYYPIVQGEFLLSEYLTGVARISYSNDSFLFGGGFKYRLNDGYGYIPTVSIQSIYNYLVTDADDPYRVFTGYDRVKFNAWNLKNAVIAFFPEVPYFNPYVFVSYDVTGLHAITSERHGSSSIISGAGYGAGGTISLEPINLGFSISMYDGNPNYNFGVLFGF